MKSYDFIKSMPEEAKLTYSREIYKRLYDVEGELSFRRQKEKGVDLHLSAGTTSVDDRFLFLYLANKMHEDLSETDYLELAPFIYMMRSVSLPFELDEKLGVKVSPDYAQWAMNDEGTDGKQVFRETWSFIQGYRSWIRECFTTLPDELAYIVAEQSPVDDIIIAA